MGWVSHFKGGYAPPLSRHTWPHAKVLDENPALIDNLFEPFVEVARMVLVHNASGPVQEQQRLEHGEPSEWNAWAVQVLEVHGELQDMEFEAQKGVTPHRRGRKLLGVMAIANLMCALISIIRKCIETDWGVGCIAEIVAQAAGMILGKAFGGDAWDCMWGTADESKCASFRPPAEVGQEQCDALS